MSAGLHHILHSGHQDERLVGPALSWYQRRIERTGRYTTQWKRVDFDTTPTFGTRAVATIPVAGELLSRVYLVAELPSFGPVLDAAAAVAAATGKVYVGPRIGYTNSVGHALTEAVELRIGNSAFDRLTSRLLETLDEYKTPLEQLPLVNDLIKRADSGFRPGLYGGVGAEPVVATVPLPFWCTRGDVHSFLPLDALSASRVQVAVQFRRLEEMIVSDALPFTPTGQAVAEAAAATGSTGSTAATNCDFKGKNALYAAADASGTTGAAVVGEINYADFRLGQTYLMVEYVYVDKLEAYAWRNGMIQYPMTQHTTLPIVQSNGSRFVSIDIPYNNPIRFLYLSLQRADAAAYNMHFHACRELVNYRVALPGSASADLWWPDASGLGWSGALVPGYTGVESEPITSMELVYEGKYTKTKTLNPALYRSLIPSLEMTKTPWVNRYYYCIPFGLGESMEDGQSAAGEANWNKITSKRLQLELSPEILLTGQRGGVPNYNVYVHIEGCNVLNIYGGTGSLLFDY
jgi:hypothetical protein